MSLPTYHPVNLDLGKEERVPNRVDQQREVPYCGGAPGGNLATQDVSKYVVVSVLPAAYL
ncbi:hypothetical protein LLE49_01340 [Alicyclobacillus tolerans]|uniref:hypothetical protein n=1 Tax=Alicyclobacillus tolerans TaxID=90970 RepID=UPI001F19EA94|nr:hypothetical protein [Alicyclobacillus tolerans]MCF8563388.1 hypothetical protein [Alicyclobacillus tolerans]